MTATFFANTWLNARRAAPRRRSGSGRPSCMHARSPHEPRAVAVITAGGGVAAELTALLVTWTAATLGRLFVLDR